MDARSPTTRQPDTDGPGVPGIARRIGLFVILALLVPACSPASKVGGLDTPPLAAPSTPSVHADRYYLSTCASCGGVLGAKGEAIERMDGDRELRFCQARCAEAFDRDPGLSIARADAAMIADQLPHYPISTSLADGRPLGARPIDLIWNNRLFRARDQADRARVLADPAAAQRTLDRAVLAAQTAAYGMPAKCPVQGDILPTDAVIDLVIANRMVRVCCERCARVVRARPYQYLSMIDYANRQAAGSARASPGTDH